MRIFMGSRLVGVFPHNLYRRARGCDGYWQGKLMTPSFDLQGHRGARGLKPENTLPAFEVAFDLGVTTVETDLPLTRDGVPVLCHDPTLDGQPVSTLDLARLREYRADRNPDPRRFPEQDAGVTP